MTKLMKFFHFNHFDNGVALKLPQSYRKLIIFQNVDLASRALVGVVSLNVTSPGGIELLSSRVHDDSSCFSLPTPIL